MPFQAGYDKYAAWKVSGAGAYKTLKVTDHTWKEAVDKIDITHTGTSGMQALLAGILRGQGTIKAKYNTDAGEAPHAAAVGIRAGYRGLLQLYLGGATAFIIPGMIIDVQYQSAVAGAVEYQFTVELDYNAIAVDTYTYPT